MEEKKICLGSCLNISVSYLRLGYVFSYKERSSCKITYEFKRDWESFWESFFKLIKRVNSLYNLILYTVLNLNSYFRIQNNIIFRDNASITAHVS